MKFLFVLIMAVLVVVALADSDKAWKEFKEKHGKQYRNKEHEAKSRLNFEKNDQRIKEHNKKQVTGEETYTLDHNELSDLDLDEFKQTRCGLKVDQVRSLTKSRNGGPVQFNTLVDVRQTGTVDYSTDSCMTPPKDQRDCGSCYAFSAVAALEYYNCKKTGVKKTFSEQQFVDCSGAYNNNGCNGGFYSNCYDYMTSSSFGVSNDTVYNYTGLVQTCKYKSTLKAGSVTSYKWSLPQGDETALMTAFTNAKGPVNVGVDAGLSSFQLYSGGVYSDKNCTTNANHAVLLVGYGTLNGLNYWKIKNSWGTRWGINGYMFLQRGVNRCGIAGYALYPMV